MHPIERLDAVADIVENGLGERGAASAAQRRKRKDGHRAKAPQVAKPASPLSRK